MKPFPDVLWYYTSGSTFAEIIKRKQIWSTQISCLNDTTEFRRSVKLLRDAFIPYLEDTKYDEETRWLANYLYKDLISDGADTSFFFVMCMSNKRDDLSPGRAYGGGEGGVSIGLVPRKDRVPAFDIDAANFAYLVPVSYNKADQEKLARTIAAVVLHLCVSKTRSVLIP